jgi:putative oxidoreductase
VKKLLVPPYTATRLSIGLLVLRLVMGAAFMLHGLPKIKNAAGWMGPDAAIPVFFIVLAAVAEFFGGLAWVIGLLMPLASFGILCTMAVATFFHASKGDPFVGMGGPSYEPALVYFCIALLFILAGPGRYSADAKIFKN